MRTDSANRVGGLDRFGIRYIVREQVRPLVYFVLMALMAGTWYWWNAWVFVILLQLLTISYHLILTRVNPAVLNARGKRHPGTKRPDFYLLSLMLISGLGIPLIGALDVGREGWTASAWMVSAGVFLTIAGFLGVTWAMAVNPHFEVTVRIQADRNHQVYSSGPYNYLRHPGYSFGMLAILAYPLILGSAWALLPTVILEIIVVIRTAFEDKVLARELEGYRDYSGRVQYRLIPGLW